MELSEDFLKLLIISITIVGILSIFFIFIQYNIIIFYEDSHREAVVLGDTLLSHQCLTEIENNYPVKSLFLESKIDDIISGEGECIINYNKGTIVIELLDKSKPTWTIILWKQLQII